MSFFALLSSRFTHVTKINVKTWKNFDPVVKGLLIQLSFDNATADVSSEGLVNRRSWGSVCLSSDLACIMH